MLEYFIEEAKAVTVAEVISVIGLKIPGHNGEHAGPCPVCGGKDRFSYNTRKNAWNCRGCGHGGRGGLGLVAHVNGFDMHKRDDFIAACAAALGRDAPTDDAEPEHARQKRQQALATRQEAAQQEDAKRRQEQNAYREKERQRAREKWQAGRLLSATAYNRYLMLRCGGIVSSYPLRLLAEEPYFISSHGGKPVVIHKGPAMVAPFVAIAGDIIGCHLTWIDLDNGPKYRPVLTDDRSGHTFPAKKMRGSKKGGIIPLAGFFLSQNGIFKPDDRRQRMVLGEGIETVLAMRLAEGERADTIYAAAGDLGNLVGPADPSSRFYHPLNTTVDQRGRKRPVPVQGSVPADLSDRTVSAWVPDWISELVLIADSDSEPVMTAAAMCRGRTRYAAHGRRIVVIWPPRGKDVADMMSVINDSGADT